jgi:hypothetical protein
MSRLLLYKAIIITSFLRNRYKLYRMSSPENRDGSGLSGTGFRDIYQKPFQIESHTSINRPVDMEGLHESLVAGEIKPPLTPEEIGRITYRARSEMEANCARHMDESANRLLDEEWIHDKLTYGDPNKPIYAEGRWETRQGPWESLSEYLLARSGLIEDELGLDERYKETVKRVIAAWRRRGLL